MPRLPSRSAAVVALAMTFAAVAPVGALQVGGLKIVVLEGEDAVNIIQQKTAVAPVVEVRDRNDLPIAGVPVSFTIGGTKTATFAGGAQTVTVTTNAAGRAAAAGFTPIGNGTVQVNVSAVFQGQTATATITQTNVATAAQASQAGSTGTQAAAKAGGFPLKTVILLGAAGAGGYTAYDLYQKYGPSSGSSCSGGFGNGVSEGPAAGGTFPVTIEESCPFRVTIDVPWITLSVSSTQVFQPQTLTFTVTFAPNPGPARNGMLFIALADGSGGAGIGVRQAGAAQGTFRGTVASVSAVAFSAASACDHLITLSNVTATVAGLHTGALQGEVTLLETRSTSPGCPAATSPTRRTYMLQTASVSNQTVIMRFVSSNSNAAHPALLLSGTLSDDNRMITGTLTSPVFGSELTVPITFIAGP